MQMCDLDLENIFCQIDKKKGIFEHHNQRKYKHNNLETFINE